MTIPLPSADFLTLANRPLAVLSTPGPVVVEPDTWTPIPWTAAPVDTHDGFDAGYYRAPMADLYQAGLTVKFAYQYQFALSFAVLVDGVRAAELVALQQGWREEDDFDDAPPPLVHASQPYAALFGAEEGQRVELAVHHTSRVPIGFTGANGGTVEGTVRWLSDGADWR